MRASGCSNRQWSNCNGLGSVPRYVLLHRGGLPPQSELDSIMSTPGVRVIDHEIKRTLLIESDEKVVEELRRRLSPNWLISPEEFYLGPE
jgi:hypothetical protein